MESGLGAAVAVSGPSLRAELIAIGSELLLGGRLDTNSLFLSDKLAELGVEARFKTQVGDDHRDIVAAIRTACRRAAVVVLTGGLGPTEDDCTREAVAEALGRPLRRHADALDAVRRRLAEWRRPVQKRHLRQALIPRGAMFLRNPVGSAPGFMLTRKGARIVVLPGVPEEAAGMFESAVAPALSRALASAAARAVIVRRTVHTFGLSEADVERRLQGLELPHGSLRLGLLASPLGVTVSLTSVAAPRGRLRSGEKRPAAPVDAAVRKIKARLGAHVYGCEAETMEEVVGRLLSAAGLTLSVAESCTGGLICHRLTQVPGSSTYLDRGVVCYSNAAKVRWLKVSPAVVRRHGAVSAEVAAAMARGVRLSSGNDLGLSVTGIAGPTGATKVKPVGLVYLALDAKGLKRPIVREHRFFGDRPRIKLRASQAALNQLRLHLMER